MALGTSFLRSSFQIDSVSDDDSVQLIFLPVISLSTDMGVPGPIGMPSAIRVGRRLLFENFGYFRKQMEAEGGTSNALIVPLVVSPITFNLLYQFVASGSQYVDLNWSNINTILQAATVLEIPSAVAFCEKFFKMMFQCLGLINNMLVTPDNGLNGRSHLIRSLLPDIEATEDMHSLNQSSTAENGTYSNILSQSFASSNSADFLLKTFGYHQNKNGFPAGLNIANQNSVNNIAAAVTLVGSNTTVKPSTVPKLDASDKIDNDTIELVVDDASSLVQHFSFPEKYSNEQPFKNSLHLLTETPRLNQNSSTPSQKDITTKQTSPALKKTAVQQRKRFANSKLSQMSLSFAKRPRPMTSLVASTTPEVEVVSCDGPIQFQRILNPHATEMESDGLAEGCSSRSQDKGIRFFPCKACNKQFPSYYFVHKHRRYCDAVEPNAE